MNETISGARQMNNLKQQAGVSILGILVIVCLFSFFLTVGLRIIPAYMEGRYVRAAVEQVVKSSDSTMSLREINRRVASTFNTNMINGIKPKDVKVYREKETIMIDASYEARVNLFKGIDAVLVFDDLIFPVD